MLSLMGLDYCTDLPSLLGAVKIHKSDEGMIAFLTSSLCLGPVDGGGGEAGGGRANPRRTAVSWLLSDSQSSSTMTATRG